MIQQIPLFKSTAIHDCVIHQLVMRCSIQYFSTGQVILKEGQYNSKLFFIVSGNVVVRKTVNVSGLVATASSSSETTSTDELNTSFNSNNNSFKYSGGSGVGVAKISIDASPLPTSTIGSVSINSNGSAMKRDVSIDFTGWDNGTVGRSLGRRRTTTFDAKFTGWTGNSNIDRNRRGTQVDYTVLSSSPSPPSAGADLLKSNGNLSLGGDDSAMFEIATLRAGQSFPELVVVKANNNNNNNWIIEY